MKHINDLRGVSVQDVPADQFINEFAAYLEKSGNFEVPKWADFVKTAVQRELAPYENNWLFVRAAAIARKVYIRGGLGVGALRSIFGSNKRNGTVSSHHRVADGKIIRYCMKQLGKMGFLDLVIVQAEDEAGKLVQISTKGKKLTKKGRAEMDKIATQIYKRAHPRKA